MPPLEKIAITHLPGLVVARYLGDSSEEALHAFTALWKKLGPARSSRASGAPEWS
jgi:hypothetical protein